MLKKVKYKQEYFELASRIIHAKGKKEEEKTYNDVFAIDCILSRKDTIINPYSLDERVRREYKWIERLEELARSENRGRIVSWGEQVYLSESEILDERLRSDLRGIYADVLIRHAEIKCLDELFLVE